MKHIPIRTPEDSAGALYFKTDIPPEEVFKAIGRLRKEARDEIDRLIRFLDDTENHMEREPEDEGDDADLEDDDPGEDDGLSEPSLGSIGDTHHFDQERWATGGTKDLEDEHDGAEPDDDGEPSLGSCDCVTNQERSWHRENPLSVDLEEGAR